jgi:hypothetical protein
MDLAEIASDEVPEARRGALPMFVSSYLAMYLSAWSSGTVVIMSDLDRLSPQSVTRLRVDITNHLRFVFARFLEKIDLRVDGERIAPVDPLCVTAGGVNGTIGRTGAADRQAVKLAG